MAANSLFLDNLTIQDCAGLANLVYNKPDHPTLGWTQFGPTYGDPRTGFNGADTFQGFYGATYVRGEDMVVAYRGTANWTDAVDDACMVPVKTPEQARMFGWRFMLHYTQRPDWTAEVMGNVFETIFKLPATQCALRQYANQIPPDHAQKAILIANLAQKYAQKNASGIKYNLRCFVGHSLGGALAQYASEQTGVGGQIEGGVPIPGVSFNGPCMGNIAGMRRGFGGGIVAVHNELDPLSLATNIAGNASHAGREGLNEFTLKVTPKYDVPPPPAPSFPLRQALPKVAMVPILKWLGGAAGFYHDMDTVFRNLGGAASRPLNQIYPYQDPAGNHQGGERRSEPHPTIRAAS
jgi:hypothetical protein